MTAARFSENLTQKSAEEALRESEERFRTLVQFSFDVYWETDAQHRFTRQEFSHRLADAPPSGSEIGKTRWEVPYLEPDEEAWRQHRATLDAHLPFRDFELARPTPDGGKRYVSVSGMPVFDKTGCFVGYRGVGRHITERKRAEAEHRSHLQFLQSVDRIDRIIQRGVDLEQILSDVLEEALDIFACDRAWLIYPCDPAAASCRVVMGRTRPPFAVASARQSDIPIDAQMAGALAAALESGGALLQVPALLAERFAVRSGMAMALRPKGDAPYLFGLHQCSQARAWTAEEQRLFEEIGHRLTDALTSLLMLRSLRESEARFRAFVDQATDGFFLHGEDSKIIDVNQQACVNLGYSREELIGMHPRQFDAGLDQASLARIMERIGKGEAVSFETLHRRKDASVFPVEVRVRQFQYRGRALYASLVRDTSERRRADEERRAHLWFLESMDRINRAMQGSDDLEKVMSDVLGEVLAALACDRAFLVYPCNPDTPSWRGVMERTRPEVTGAFGLGNELPMTADGAEVARAALASSGALLAGPAHERQVKPEFTERLGVRSSMLMALHPKGDQPYLFGVHQCSRPRTWTPDERRLFEEIGHRIGAALTSLIALRGLRESEQRLEEAQRVAHLGYWDRDFAANRVVLSEESWRIFGVEPHERPADLAEWTRRWEAFIHPEDRPRVLAAVQAALGGGPRYDVEFRILRKDGDVRVLHVQGDVIRDAAGRPVRMFGTQQDITALRQSEHRLQAAQRIARVGWWERDYRTNKVSLSDETCRIFGVQPLDLPQWHGRWLSLIHPEDRARVAAASEAALCGGPRYDVEYRILCPDGTVRVVHSQGDITRDDSGRALRQFGVMQDITELWQAQQELRSRQDMLDLAQKAARAVAFDWHIGERESENRWSPDLEAMYGLEPGTFDRTYRGWKKLVHPDDWPAVKLAIERAQESGDVAAEYRVIHKDGSVHWLQAKGRMFFDAGRRPGRMVGFMIDVTDRRRAEEELRATEARFRTFVDHATDAFFLLDAELTVIDVNRQACQSLGYRREELIGMRPRDFDAALDQTSIARFAERAEAGETVTFETLHRRKDGDVFPVEIRAGTFLQGGRRFHLSLARDIRERKRAEEALRESDHALQRARAELAHVSRVMTMGELTASIAHEVNQPLGAMVANAAACSRWLAAKPPETAKARRALESIAADGRRASEVIGRIRSLMKRQTPRKESLQINVQIRQVIALAEYELRRNEIVLRTQLADALPCVEGDSVQLQQVLLNLIVNAIEAMSEIRDRPRELTVVSRREGSNAVVAEVRDSGTGLEPGRAERLFQAFYTTKPEGLGIGLSISRSIVEAHGGRLWAEPNAPRGAVFRFSLPVEA